MITIKYPRQLVFLIIAIISAVFVYITPAEYYLIKSFFRLVPMITLLYYATLQLSAKKMPVHILLFIGLICSMGGDAVYYWPVLEYIIAPFAILNGFMFYTIGFLTQIRFSIMRLLTIIPIGVSGYILIRVLFEELDKSGAAFLIFFIFVYIFFAAIMCWTAFLTGNKWVISSALLFAASDTLRSINQFILQGVYVELVIILLYFGAQYFIVQSLGSFSKKPKKEAVT